MDFISKGNYTVLPLSKIVDHCGRFDLPDKTVAITIDDAYQSVLQKLTAAQSSKFSLPVFVATQQWIAIIGYMSWDKSILQDEGGKLAPQNSSAYA